MNCHLKSEKEVHLKWVANQINGLQLTPAPISTVNGAKTTCRQGEVHRYTITKNINASYDLG